MNLIKRITDLYINGSIHVAFSCYALTWLTLIELGLDYNEELLYFVFYATISGYNFVKFFGVAQFHHRSLTKALRWIQILSLVCTFAMFYYFFKLDNLVKVWGGIMFALTLIYALPLFPKQKKVRKNLRNVYGVKVYIIALVWAGVTYVIPLFYSEQNLSFIDCVNVFLRFLFILLLMLPFELRDLKSDHPNLGTIPQLLGEKKTKQLSVFLAFVIVLVSFFSKQNHHYLIVEVIIVIITMLSTWFYNENKSALYSSFYVESIPILWLLILLLI